MTIEELDADVRQFVRELDGRKREERETRREEVKVETKTLTGKAAELYDRSLSRTFTRVNPNSNNSSPNAP